MKTLNDKFTPKNKENVKNSIENVHTVISLISILLLYDMDHHQKQINWFLIHGQITNPILTQHAIKFPSSHAEK